MLIVGRKPPAAELRGMHALHACHPQSPKPSAMHSQAATSRLEDARMRCSRPMTGPGPDCQLMAPYALYGTPIELSCAHELHPPQGL